MMCLGWHGMHKNYKSKPFFQKAITWSSSAVLAILHHSRHRLVSAKRICGGLQETMENCFLQGQLSVQTLISVSIPSLCYRNSMQKILAKSAVGKLQLNTQAPYKCGWLQMKWHCKLVHGCMVYTECMPRWHPFHKAAAINNQLNGVVSTSLRWVFKKQNMQSFIHNPMQEERSLSAWEREEQCHIKWPISQSNNLALHRSPAPAMSQRSASNFQAVVCHWQRQEVCKGWFE